MAKKEKKESKQAEKEIEQTDPKDPLSKLPKDVQQKLKEIKGKLEQFQKEVLKKFEHYIMGIALLPPEKKGEKVLKDKINVLVLVDDTDSQRMTKQELKEKLGAIYHASIAGKITEINEDWIEISSNK